MKFTVTLSAEVVKQVTIDAKDWTDAKSTARQIQGGIPLSEYVDNGLYFIEVEDEHGKQVAL